MFESETLVKRDSADPSGIFLAFFAAEFGNSMGIFLVKDGVMTGGDVGGATYEGEYKVEGDLLAGEVKIFLAAGSTTITGASTDIPSSYPTKVSFKLPIESTPFHSIDTITGPVNIRFQKIKEI